MWWMQEYSGAEYDSMVVLQMASKLYSFILNPSHLSNLLNHLKTLISLLRNCNFKLPNTVSV